MSNHTWLDLPDDDMSNVSWKVRDDGNVTQYLATQDVTPILERNKAMYNHNDGYSPSRDLRRVAHIPDIVIVKWKEELGVDFWNPDHKPKVMALLNSNEYLFLRTAEGCL